MNKEFSMGGQALLEGVMMNGPHFYTATVRKNDGSLVSAAVRHTEDGEPKKWSKIPVLRGVISFVRSLKLGMEAMNYASDFYMEEPQKDGKATDAKKNEARDSVVTVIALVLAVGIFVVLPILLSKWLIRPYIDNLILISLSEGALRLLIFFLYLFLISLVPDIRRTFEYHGAEHKTVACYEAGDALTVENARRYSRLNRRCGTSFIFITMIIGMVLFMFIPIVNTFLRIVVKMALLPLVAGISYEILKASARSKARIWSVLIAPGLWFQRITTREPDDGELETAINSAILILMKEGLPVPEGSLEPVLPEEKG